MGDHPVFSNSKLNNRIAEIRFVSTGNCCTLSMILKSSLRWSFIRPRQLKDKTSRIDYVYVHNVCLFAYCCPR